MGIGADIEQDWHAALAALAWQYDLGVAEVIGETPASAYDLPERAPWQRGGAAPTPAAAPATPPTDLRPNADTAAALSAAETAARAAQDMNALTQAMLGFNLCEMKQGARGAVVGLGNPAAHVLVLTDAPSAEEEKARQPLLGDARLLFDRMFSAIGLSLSAEDPARALYLTPAMPWHPRGSAVQQEAALAMMCPFALRAVALAKPRLVVVMGAGALHMTLRAQGLMRMRGTWHEIEGRPAVVMQPCADIAQNPSAKRDAWADLQAIRARLQAGNL